MEFVWPAAPAPALASPCPVCQAPGPHALAVIVPGGGLGGADWLVLRCTGCDCRFSPDREGADYSGADDTPLHDTGSDFYLEFGAGIDAMLTPLGWLPPGQHRLLEIGGGVGFVSDYAHHALGWSATGYDPSPLGRLGREILGLDNHQAYFGPDTPLPAPYDLVSATEVIEHVPDPIAFIRLIARAAGDRGIVVMTTPNGAALQPSTPEAALGPLLSPGLHLTLFSARALDRAARAAGFTHVRVDEQTTELHVYASNQPLPDGIGHPLSRHTYIDYLQRRLDTSAPLYDRLDSGLRYRLFKELTNAGDYFAALKEFTGLCEQAAQRHGLDLARPESFLLPPSAPDFKAFVAAHPCHLGATLYYRAIIANNHEGDARRASLYAAAAIVAGVALRQALRKVGMDNGEIYDLSVQAMALLAHTLGGQGIDPRPLLRRLAAGRATEGLLLAESDRRALVDRAGSWPWSPNLGFPNAADTPEENEADDEQLAILRPFGTAVPLAQLNEALKRCLAVSIPNEVEQAFIAARFDPVLRPWPGLLDHLAQQVTHWLLHRGHRMEGLAFHDCWSMPTWADVPILAESLHLARQKPGVAIPLPDALLQILAQVAPEAAVWALTAPGMPVRPDLAAPMMTALAANGQTAPAAKLAATLRTCIDDPNAPLAAPHWLALGLVGLNGLQDATLARHAFSRALRAYEAQAAPGCYDPNWWEALAGLCIAMGTRRRRTKSTFALITADAARHGVAPPADLLRRLGY